MMEPLPDVSTILSIVLQQERQINENLETGIWLTPTTIINITLNQGNLPLMVVFKSNILMDHLHLCDRSHDIPELFFKAITISILSL